MQTFHTFDQAYHYLVHELPKTSSAVFKDEASFERSRKLLELLGNPQNAHLPIHVAGTSGKGSVCYLVDTILRSQGKRTSLMVSPHVYDVRERVQVNGQLISKHQFVHNLNHILQVIGNEHPSYFETLTCLGFYTASQFQLDYQVVEVGFGGLWDTTNVMDGKPKICSIGQIGLDHTAVLGNTIELIAKHKVGIIKPNNIVVALRQEEEVNQIIEQTVSSTSSTLVWVERNQDYQESNDAMALAIVRQVSKRDGWTFDEVAAKESVERIFIPGRFEKRDFKEHLVILDGAHNPQKLAALSRRLQVEGIAPCTFILAIGERKDWQSCLEQLKPVAAQIITTEFFSEAPDMPHKALPAAQLAQAAQECGIKAEASQSVADALRKATSYKESVVATGSFYLLSEIDAALSS